MDAVVAFIANGEATKPVEPGERALDDPAEHAKAAAVGLGIGLLLVAMVMLGLFGVVLPLRAIAYANPAFLVDYRGQSWGSSLYLATC